MNTDKNLWELLREKKYLIACSYLDNDIKNLPEVVKAIETKSIDHLYTPLGDNREFEDEFIMCSIYSIVSNPFDFYNILDKKSFDVLLDFCIRNILKHDLGELAIASIVFLNKQDIILTKKDGSFFIKERQVTPEMAYSLLAQYSKGRKITINFKEIDEEKDFDFNSTMVNIKEMNFLCGEENPLILRHKIEILSSQVKHYEIKKKVLEEFTRLLNHQNVSIGWALANEMVNMSKYFEIDGFIEELKGRCLEIFANESLWINTLSILGILTLKGEDVGDVEKMVELALLYDNEFVYRSSLLREHCVFLIWSLLKKYLTQRDKRSEEALKKYFDLLVFVLIFDSSYNVRRAVASVISEYVGVFSLENGYSFLQLVDKNYHKRLENSDLLIEELSTFYDVGKFQKRHLILKLSHYNNLIKEATAYLIVKSYDTSSFVKSYDTSSFKKGDHIEERIGALYILIYSLKLKQPLMNVNDLNSCKLDDKLYRTRNSSVFIYLYLACLTEMKSQSILDRFTSNHEDILDNLFFLLTKNIFSLETSKLCWSLATETFNKKLLRRNSESFILVNVLQKEFPVDKYKQNLASTSLDIRIATYKALKYMKDPELFKVEIKNGLEDYTVDRRGDISYKIRLECLYLALYLGMDVEGYIVRYLVDKSKYLREYTLVLLNHLNIFKVYKHTTVYPRKAMIHFYRDKLNTRINPELVEFLEVKSLCPDFKSELIKFLNLFDESFEVKQKEMSKREEAYFEGMLIASASLPDDYRSEFFSGLYSTISVSDKTLSDFLLRKAQPVKNK